MELDTATPNKLKSEKKRKLLIAVIIILCISIFFLILYNYKYLIQYKTDNFKTLVEFKSSNIKGINGRQVFVHKEFKKYLKELNRYANQYELHMNITHSYRSKKQVLSNTIVRPAKLSNHQAGFAVDFNIVSKGIKYFSNDLKKKNHKKLPLNIQKFIMKLQLHPTLRWGGNFRTEDPVHIDIPLNLKNRRKFRKFSEDCALDYSNKIPKWKFWK